MYPRPSPYTPYSNNALLSPRSIPHYLPAGSLHNCHSTHSHPYGGIPLWNLSTGSHSGFRSLHLSHFHVGSRVWSHHSRIGDIRPMDFHPHRYRHKGSGLWCQGCMRSRGSRSYRLCCGCNCTIEGVLVGKRIRLFQIALYLKLPVG